MVPEGAAEVMIFNFSHLKDFLSTRASRRFYFGDCYTQNAFAFRTIG